MDVDCGQIALPQTQPDTRPARRLTRLLGYAIGVAGLVWVLHDVNVREISVQAGRMTWWLILPAMALDVLSYVCQGVRWHLLLEPAGSKLSVVRATQAIYVALFANELMPMRIGEVLRAYLGGRWSSTRVSAIVPSMVVERALDGMLAAGLVLVAAQLLPIPPSVRLAALLLGGAMVVVAAIFAALGTRYRSILRSINARTLSLATACSLLLLLCQAGAFWLMMRAYGLSLPFASGLVVYLVVRVGTAVPSTPANVGTYQFFTVAGLAIFGVGKTAAAGFSVVVFLVLTLPLWTLGLIALGQSGMSLADIRSLRLSTPART